MELWEGLSRIRQLPHLPARIVLIFAILGFGVAIGGHWWDSAWHNTHPFDEFWSPPHRLLYAGIGLALGTSAAGLFSGSVRNSFGGPNLRLPFLAPALPAPLVLMALGALFAILSGMVDSAWHAALRGAESDYSLPHQFLKTGAIQAILGVLSGVLLLRDQTPQDLRGQAWAVPLLGAGVMVGFVSVIGTFSVVQTEVVGRIGNPALQVDPGFITLQRRILELGFVVDNPLLAPAILGLVFSAPLAMVQRLRPRGLGASRAVGLILLAVIPLTLGGHLTGQVPPSILPVVALAGVMALVADLWDWKEMGSSRWGWALGGLALGLVHNGIFGWNPVGVALAAAGASVGSGAGRSLGALVSKPSPRGVALALLTLGVVVPVVVGGLDTLLRDGRYWWVV